MHDTNPNPKKRMPPLIVLGLTGPVCSGCTTVSNQIFDNPDNPKRGKGNELLRVLNLVGWVRARDEGGFDVNWTQINKEIDQTYRKLDLVRKAMRAFDVMRGQGDPSKLKNLVEELRKELNNASDKRIEEVSAFRAQVEELEDNLRRKLKEDLESREAIKALDKLNAYYRQDTHLFRTISVSDLIVFRAMMAIEKEDFNIDSVRDAHKKEKYGEFIAIAKEHMSKEKAKSILGGSQVERYGDYYKRCYDWEDKNELNRLGEAFYDVHGIAAVIKREFHKKHPCDYSEVMQDFGDNIRQCDDPFGRRIARIPDNAYKLAKGVAQMIYVLYKTGQGAFFVVDCLRNPYEVLYLRREFANFFLLSLYADKEIRERRFTTKARRTWARKFQESETRAIFRGIDERDSGKNVEGKEVAYKQNVTQCVRISDIAITNMTEWPGNIDVGDMKIEEVQKAVTTVREFCRKALRILCLILNPGCTKPSDDEMCMNMAYAMAVKSNCISRQVGAVIVGPKGYIVGAGWNDVGEGKTSCGLRAIRDLPRDKEFRPLVEGLLAKDDQKIKRKDIRELAKELSRVLGGANKSIPGDQFCFCFKDEMVKRDITPRLVMAWRRKVDETVDVLKSEGGDELKSVPEQTLERGKEAVKRSGEQILEDLVEKGHLHQLESCLALHAEENAIIQSSKIGGMGLKGGAIYTTAQPCRLCAKAIQQIGLSKVVYTEPYPESLSEVYMKGVDLQQFEGVKPRAYIKLFMAHHDHKEWQQLESRNLVPAI